MCTVNNNLDEHQYHILEILIDSILENRSIENISDKLKQCTDKLKEWGIYSELELSIKKPIRNRRQ